MGAFTTLMVTASAAAADDKFEKYKPAGIGALLPAPKSSYSGAGTLYEQYGNPMLYDLDVQLGWDEFGDWALQFVAVIFMGLTVVLALAAIVVVQWTFKFTSIDKLEDSISHAISGAASTVSTTLLPSAMAIGAVIAYANHRRNGSSISQLGWVAATAILSISLLTTPKVWIEGIDSIRTIGSNTAMQAASAGMGNETKEPIDIGDQPTYGGNQQDNMLRKSADAIWRSYVVTPWCVAEFGNLNVCKEHGKDLLDLPADDDKREEWLKNNVSDKTVGGEAVKYRQGHMGHARVMVAMASAVCAGLFAILAVALAFASLASLIGALMLLLAGVVFACLWVIPGRPRQWGVRWFDTLLGFTLQSFVSTMVLGCVLVLNTASVSLVGPYGWFASAGVSITSAIVAFKFRGIMESIVGVTGATNSSFNAGAMRLAQQAGGAVAKGAGGAAWGAGKFTGKGVGKGAWWGTKKTGAGVAWAGKKAAGAADERFIQRPFRMATAAKQLTDRHANMDALGIPKGSPKRTRYVSGADPGGRNMSGEASAASRAAKTGSSAPLSVNRASRAGDLKVGRGAGAQMQESRKNQQAGGQNATARTGRPGTATNASAAAQNAARRQSAPGKAGGSAGEGRNFRGAPTPGSGGAQRRVADARKAAAARGAASASGATTNQGASRARRRTAVRPPAPRGRR
ncbi:type IV secretion system protein [Streptomyces rectiverticillatus]|uniref:hypothetical protein n=1 Tax=Streptomyces rectiverticillatus TaxID=173860 RepID=UPI0015C40B84|nr:hypothetical protein [Streptomyces rectiverticillatus]QLE72842.1 type IV secretion system protein [Streptomyces rectiverticillatus]